MKTKQEIRDWILENCVDKDGNVDMSNLDFSKFEGNIRISHMKVKKSLIQSQHEVGGYLNQEWHKVGKDLCQAGQEVCGNLYQDDQEVEGNLYQCRQKVKGYAHIGADDFAGIAEFVDWMTRWKIIKEK